jgi:hypothetical protein
VPDYSIINQAQWVIGPIFPAGFRHPFEMEISGELQFEPTILGPGFCKMVLNYSKWIFPDENTRAEAPAACNAEAQRTGEFVLYKSGYQPTDTTTLNCATSQPPTSGWNTACGAAGSDAYRWGPIFMTKSECLDTYVSD